MTDRMQSSDIANKVPDSEGGKNVSNKRTLDTFFPSTWLVALMVVIVLVFNIIVGMKVLSLQKEKAVVEMLRDRYESYGKMIRDIEEKQELLRSLTNEVPPLEMRKENALRAVSDSEKALKDNKSALDIVLAEHGEVSEKLNTMRKSIAELSHDKQSLQREKEKLDKVVVELRVDQERTEQEIKKSRLDLRSTKEEVQAVEMQLKEQQGRIEEVATANSSFEKLRNQLSEFTRKMDETQSAASQKIKSLDEVLAGVVEQKDKLSLQSSKLTEEAKNISQTNAAIKSEIDSFQQQTKGYQSELEKVAATSGQMKSTIETINDIAVKVKGDEVIVSDNLNTIKNGLIQIQTTGEELAQIRKDFNTALLELTAQREKIGAYLKEVASLSGMKGQTESLQKILNELEAISNKLSEKVSTLQNSFDAKLEGMNLSFETLEKDFNGLSAKVIDLEETLENIAAKTPDLKPDTQKE